MYEKINQLILILFKNALSLYDTTTVLFLSFLLLFVEYFNWLNSFFSSPNTNSGFLLWFIALCQELAVAMFQIHLVSRCDGGSQQLFFFGMGKARGKEWKWGVTGCCGEAVISQSSRGAQGDRHQAGDGAGSCASMSVLGVTCLQHTWCVCLLPPIWISKQLQQTLLPIPVELAVVVFLLLL